MTKFSAGGINYNWQGGNFLSFNKRGLSCAVLNNTCSYVGVPIEILPNTKFDVKIQTSLFGCKNACLYLEICNEHGSYGTIKKEISIANSHIETATIITNECVAFNKNTSGILKIRANKICGGAINISKVVIRRIDNLHQETLKKLIVAYVAFDYRHKRVFSSTTEKDDILQFFIAPRPIIASGYLFNQNYNDVSVRRHIYFDTDDRAGQDAIIKKLQPDLVLDASLTVQPGLGYKKSYVSHGLIGKHVSSMISSGEIRKVAHWKNNDLYFGATHMFKDFLRQAIGVENKKIVLNAMPQFDLLLDNNEQVKNKKFICNKLNIDFNKKIILFAGFCCAIRSDFSKNHYNEDYFVSSIRLAQLAEANNFLVLIKPRIDFEQTIAFAENQKWWSKYKNEYCALHDNKHVRFLKQKEFIYDFFFADLIALNGLSTLEIEGCIAEKPIFIYRQDMSKCDCTDMDYFNTMGSGSANYYSDINVWCNDICTQLTSGGLHSPEKQRALIKNLGLTIDGKMHERVHNAALKLLKEKECKT